jgi:hypothetical protein
MSVYTGTIVAGQGDASANYKVMIPEIAKDFPLVADCGLFGTINVLLDSPFDNSNADHWTPQIVWRPVVGFQESVRPETFGFIRIKFEFDAQLYDAWIIRPEGHCWTYNGLGVEVIAATQIPGVAYGKACSFRLDHTPSSPRPASFGKLFGMTGFSAR